MILSIIAAIGTNNALGNNNQLLWHMPADMQFFKRTTTGHTVIMGRKTFESFPKGALPNRRNIVVTRDPNYSKPNIEVVHSIEEALGLLKNSPSQEVFVIGGGELYKEALPWADKLYITHIDDAPEADTFFPAIGSEWQKVSEETHSADEKNPHNYTFTTYQKTA